MKPIVLIAALLCATSVFAQDAEESTELRWTPDLSMQFRSIGGTVISPDDQWIAYTITEAVMEGEKSEYLTQIHLVSADGSVHRQFTRGEISSRGAAFSPDGSHLTFTSDRSEKDQIWIISLDGGESRQLSDSENGIESYQWSPDGSRIAYTMREPDTDEEKEAKDEKRWVKKEDQDYKYDHLHVMEVDDFEEGDSQQITAGDFTVTSFDWSPDGSRLVFSHALNPSIAEGGRDQDISWVSADSGAVMPLVTRPGVDSGPRYSHDGQRIAFSSEGGQNERVGLNDFYLIDADGGEPRPLGQTYDRGARLIGWVRGDGTLIVTETHHTTSQLLVIPTSRTNVDVQQWSNHQGTMGDVTINAAGDMVAFTLQTTNSPENLYASSLDTFEPVQLTDIHADIELPPMGRTELLSWTSPDGTEIEGLLTYPTDYVYGSQVPLVLQIHGGPAGVFRQGFTGGRGIYMTQVFAQNGYAVLRPNPRGSSGYGKDFRYANIMDWGYGDWDDVESGVDAVIDMGVAHPDSLLLMGWSYGGYMTSFGVTRTDRFKAASMGAGLPNLISMVTTTDISDYLAAHMGGEYWDDYERYERHSAIYRIKNVTTPTQVIHGENDVRVPTDQGREFYVSLKRLGVETEMILLPRTPHGPREPKLLKAVTPLILDWFEQHLDRKKTVVSEGTN